jgi:hypothetical protein
VIRPVCDITAGILTSGGSRKQTKFFNFMNLQLIETLFVSYIREGDNLFQ